MNKLVEPECGGPNALVSFTGQLARGQQQRHTGAQSSGQASSSSIAEQVKRKSIAK